MLTEGSQRENLTALLAVEASMLNGNIAPLHEESIADTVIRLKMEETQRAVSRSIEIVKSRGQEFQMGRHTLRIINGQGLQVYRRVQSPRPQREQQRELFHPERMTTGIPGLDEMVNGGYQTGSTTVVAGISGVGKSVMALQYMAEGIRQRQSCLHDGRLRYEFARG